MIIIKTLPPYESIDPSLKQSNLLPPKAADSPAYTLVLDLDETLVHCVMEPIEVYDKVFNVILFLFMHRRSPMVRMKFPCMLCFGLFSRSF